MRYFIVNGYLAYPQEEMFGVSRTHGETRKERAQVYERFGRQPSALGETRIFHEPKIGTLSVFVYDFDRTQLLLRASSQRKAYLLGNTFRSITTALIGEPPVQNGFEFLVELTDKPDPSMTLDELVELYRQLDDTPVRLSTLAVILQSGMALDHSKLSWVCDFMKRALVAPRFHATLLHLYQSHQMISGYMSGSFYESHYRWERKSQSRYFREKLYYEGRTQYDLAFLSVFRAIEALLNSANLRSEQIHRLLVQLDSQYGTTFAKSDYQFYHEIFSGGMKRMAYEEVIVRYLNLRNAVAAHGSLKPPRIITDDQVFEIQLLVEDMLGHLLYPGDESE